MDTQDDQTRDTARPKTPDCSSQAAQPTHATPIRLGGTSSAAASNTVSSTKFKINLEDIAEPIKNEISRPQHCKAADMLRFLFSFCGAGGDAALVEPKEKELMRAFEMVQELANEQDTPLRDNLNVMIASKSESEMYNPLVKAFNYALDRLSKFDVPGLPKFQEDRQIVFARSDTTCINSETYLQGLYKPDIILIKWSMFKIVNDHPHKAYPESYESEICCKFGPKKSKLSWRNLLSTVEVKLGGSRAVARGGSKRSKGKAKEKFPEYSGGFGDLRGDLGAPRPPKPPQPPPQKMVSEEHVTRSFTSHSSQGNEGPSSSTADRLSLQKRRRTPQDVQGTIPKKIKSGSDTKPTGTSSQKMGTPSDSGVKKPDEGEAEEPMRPPKQAPRVQNAIYASHRISSSFDISHTINLILIGTSAVLTWVDRQNIIESQAIDLVDELPHFLLLLLIFQRFDDAKWGYFTECPESGIAIEQGERVPTVSFVAETRTGEIITIVFYPDDHEIYLGTTLIGRGTSVIGGRRGPPPRPEQFGNSERLREGNDLAVKFYWPEESRMSEVQILTKAREYGEKIDLIGNHIPEMICHLDPNFLCSSTKTIRQFLGLPTDGSRSLRVIAFRRLVPIKELKEKEMLTAYTQCFFCHYCLWKKGIHHGDISPANLMWDAERKVGVLNDFDLARFVDQAGPSGQDNTGTLPFMALDLLSEEGLRGEIPRRYRHEAESFAWCLIYLYFVTIEDKEGRNQNRVPHPLLEWFQTPKISRNAKKGLEWKDGDVDGIPLVHPNARRLAIALHKYWWERYHRQNPHPPEEDDPQPPSGTSGVERFPEGAADIKRPRDEELMLMLNPTMTQQAEPLPYKEPEDENLFRELVIIHAKATRNLEPVGELVYETGRSYNEIAWAA